jgi:hypothetical protein
MPEIDSQEHTDPRKMRESYVQLGLEPGASMRDIETAYWQFARELRGQSAMKPYTEAYEALASRITHRVNDVRATAPPAPAATAEIPQAQNTHASKFGWPAN